jgi:hypothetical protein
MKFSGIVKRELEVAFSKNAQPIWLRILKYSVLGGIVYLFWGEKLLWIILLTLLVSGLLLHFWFRYKTHGWTKSYRAWKYEENKPSSESGSEG